MENATKALLIAAAILIAIVLVSIGVFVLRQGNDAMSSVDMSEAQVLAFNSNFESYEGTQRGSQVKALIDRINSSNNKYTGDTSSQVKLASGSSVALNNNGSDVSTASFYKVEITKRDGSSKLIQEIKITKIEN